MRTNSFFAGPLPVLFVVLSGLFVAAQPAFGASSGECVTVHMGAPFRLPDGLLYPGGTLTLCDGGAYSPVDTFQRIKVDGSNVGLFVSQRRRAESPGAGVPQVQFHRGADGNLALVGFTLPSAGGNIAFRMKRPDVAWLANHRRQDEDSGSAPFAAIVASAGTH